MLHGSRNYFGENRWVIARYLAVVFPCKNLLIVVNLAEKAGARGRAAVAARQGAHHPSV
jgi:hypothetical protein